MKLIIPGNISDTEFYSIIMVFKKKNDIISAKKFKKSFPEASWRNRLIYDAYMEGVILYTFTGKLKLTKYGKAVRKDMKNAIKITKYKTPTKF